MKRKEYLDKEIAFGLQSAKAGKSAEEICRRMGITKPTFHRWKRKFAGMGVAEIRRLKLTGPRFSTTR